MVRARVRVRADSRLSFRLGLKFGLGLRRRRGLGLRVKHFFENQASQILFCKMELYERHDDR